MVIIQDNDCFVNENIYKNLKYRKTELKPKLRRFIKICNIENKTIVMDIFN